MPKPHHDRLIRGADLRTAFPRQQSVLWEQQGRMIAKELSGIPRQLLRSPRSKDGYRKVFENCSVSRGTEIKEEERLEPASDPKENIPIYLDGSLDPASTNSTNPETFFYSGGLYILSAL